MKKSLFTILITVLIIAGCDGGTKSYERNLALADMTVSEDVLAIVDDQMAPPPPPLPSQEARDGSANQYDSDIPEVRQSEDKKIIKDGSVTLKVDDIEVAKKQADSLLVLFSAYYSSENMVNSDYALNYNLAIRIPSANFEKFISALDAGDGEITNKNVNARDVTIEFIDIQSRLSNKRSYLDRYRELLKQAKSVKDVLEIEEQIRSLVEEIESSEGRLKYLTDQVAYSTLNLTIFREKGYTYRPAVKGPFGERLKRSLSGGWNGLVTFTLILIRLWPLWIIFAVVISLWIRHRRKRKA